MKPHHGHRMWWGQYAGSGAARADLSTRMRREVMNTLEIAPASPGGFQVVGGGMLMLRLFYKFLSSIVVAFFIQHV